MGGLQFPSPRLNGSGMVTDFRKALDAVAERAGWKAGEVSKAFRHTYCAARLQTLDNGAPVSIYTVGRELGHGGESLVSGSTATSARSSTAQRSWSTASSSTRNNSARNSGSSKLPNLFSHMNLASFQYRRMRLEPPEIGGLAKVFCCIGARFAVSRVSGALQNVRLV